ARMTRQLVVNADDFGLTTGINDGILEAHDTGILTSASVFPNAPATADAILRARSRPSLGLGAHLTLVDGTATLPASRIPRLGPGDGGFRGSWRPFVVACLGGQIRLADVERELTAQVERLREAGVPLTHLDSHKHVHAYPPIFTVVARLADRFGIPVVRVPYERWWSASALADTPGARRTMRRQAAMNAALWPWARRHYRVAESLGVRT